MGVGVLGCGSPSAETGEKGFPSRDIRLPNFLHGPGESFESKGEGRGVTSPMAEITGLGTVELAADAEPKGFPKFGVFRLGVLEMGLSEEDDVFGCRLRAGRLVGVGVAKA